MYHVDWVENSSVYLGNAPASYYLIHELKEGNATKLDEREALWLR